MSELIHGHSVIELRNELKQLQERFPSMGEAALRVYMIGKYGINHDSHQRLVPVSLKEVFRYDKDEEKSST